MDLKNLLFRCPSALKGDFVHIETDTNGNLQTSPCELNPQTGFPYDGECQFVPNEDQYGVSVSMMAYHFLENVCLLTKKIVKNIKTFLFLFIH